MVDIRTAFSIYCSAQIVVPPSGLVSRLGRNFDHETTVRELRIGQPDTRMFQKGVPPRRLNRISAGGRGRRILYPAESQTGLAESIGYRG